MKNKYAILEQHKGTIPLPKGKKKTVTKNDESEDQLQDKCESWLNLKGIRFIRIPNVVYSIIFGLRSIVPIWIKRKIAEYLSGIPDLVILAPTGRFNGCLLVELKTKTGKRRQAQKKWAKGLNVEEIRDFEDFRGTVIDWEKSLN